MPNIPTTAEAMQALDVLQRYVGGIHQTFVDIQGTAATPLPLRPHRSSGGSGGEPASWAARVLAILADEDGYMSPKDIIAEYRRRGWTVIPDIDKRIRSTIGQLKAAGRIFHNAEDRTYKGM